MPTALVLADKSAPYELTYELGDEGRDGKCHVFNPGSFIGASYGWTTYHTDTRKSEPRYALQVLPASPCSLVPLADC